ncbi:PdxT/SNO family [Catenaria anguillulae PL171]|uniref:glutaminase n=1 Tax=Catenaria anguillulae PL171 TaxID=765915 RepID=A0A1Y2HXS3_9FUNG|nr:PdxT/SNO family [Catenaria anguillulae PL171]
MTSTTVPAPAAPPSSTPTENQPIRIGVLALQGAFIEHVHLLERVAQHLSVPLSFPLIRTAADLDPKSLHGLVIPGGESTAIALVAERSGCLDALRTYVRARPTWGTCAGLILLSQSATHAKQGGQQLLGALDVSVDRNAFGRQAESFMAPLHIKGITDTALDGTHVPLEGVFIRAPVVTTLGDHVDVIGTVTGPKGDERIVAVRQGHLLGTSFHPELTQDTRVHKYFVDMVLKHVQAAGDSS